MKSTSKHSSHTSKFSSTKKSSHNGDRHKGRAYNNILPNHPPKPKPKPNAPTPAPAPSVPTFRPPAYNPVPSTPTPPSAPSPTPPTAYTYPPQGDGVNDDTYISSENYCTSTTWDGGVVPLICTNFNKNVCTTFSDFWLSWLLVKCLEGFPAPDDDNDDNYLTVLELWEDIWNSRNSTNGANAITLLVLSLNENSIPAEALASCTCDGVYGFISTTVPETTGPIMNLDMCPANSAPTGGDNCAICELCFAIDVIAASIAVSAGVREQFESLGMCFGMGLIWALA